MANWKRWNTTTKYFEVSTNNGSTWTQQDIVLTLAGFVTGSAPAVSEAGKATIYYNTTIGDLLLSLNGGAYAAIGMNLTAWNGTAPANLVSVNSKQSVPADINGWRASLPNVLQSGRIDAYLGALASGVLASALFKSIQYGSITLADTVFTNTYTCSPTVTKANSVLIYLGCTTNEGFGADPGDQYARITLTSGTTVTATRGRNANICIVEFCIFELP